MNCASIGGGGGGGGGSKGEERFTWKSLEDLRSNSERIRASAYCVLFMG